MALTGSISGTGSRISGLLRLQRSTPASSIAFLAAPRPAGNVSDGGNLISGRQLCPSLFQGINPSLIPTVAGKRKILQSPPLPLRLRPKGAITQGKCRSTTTSPIHTLFLSYISSWVSCIVSVLHPQALEPFFNAAASQFILGQQIPFALWLSLAPVVIGVSMASLTELSFNWLGFISAMISNISFTYRSIYSKKAMTDMDSTNLYAYISIIALIVCIPPAIIIEGPQLLQNGFNDVIAKVATNTLERVAPLTHSVGTVLKRVFVIGFSIVVFGNKISTQSGIGTCIAIAGVAIYSYIKAKMEEEKRKTNTA
ncbi:hypothetical protein KFK09_011726 [Dendrobium nobile]|uniref:Sugar phosphate transporter domain-containing protein n=1 Tax=Dendrobium nobile TaxID=94219 RepID=A0A8T3BFD3_DENNO|nr:hypothetical protein KFK09_011726 [Dendrobium nobile]